MKRIIISFLIIIICTVCVAQKFNGGIITGLTNTDVMGTDPNHIRFNKVGFTIGVFTELPVTEKSSLRMEMDYIQKGSYIPPNLAGDTIANGPDTSLKLRLSYIEIPLLYSHTFTISIGKKENTHFGIEIGPSFGFLISSSENIDQTGFSPINGTPYKKIDISGLIGLRYRIADRLNFHFRYENSIFPIRKHPSGAISFYNFQYNVGETNLVFSYTLSYTF